MRKKVLGLLLVLMLAFVGVGCSLPGGINIDPGTQTVEVDLDEVYLNVQSQIPNKDAITNDITLPTKFGSVNIKWESDNKNLIDDSGHIVRPEQDTEVILHCTLTSDKETKTYVLKVVIKAAEKPVDLTISDVKAGSIGGTYKLQATVVGVTKQGFLLQDNTGYIYVYLGNDYANDLTVGDVIELEGKTAEYKTTVQFSSATYTKKSTASVNHPQATPADLVALTQAGTAATQFVKLEGKLKISGTYNNVIVEGVTSAQGSLFTNLDLSEYDDKNIIVTGYYVYTNGSNPLYANIIVSTIELSPDQGGTSQQTPVSTIAEVKTGAVGTLYKVEATVVATSNVSFLIQDETGLILVYLGSGFAKDVVAGDVIELEGTTSTHNGLMQFGTAKYSKTGTKSISYPQPRVLDAAGLDAFAGSDAIAFDYVQVEGTLRVNGSYLNLEVSGATLKGSLVTDKATSDFADKVVVVTGFYLNNSTSSNITYANLIVTDIQLSENQGTGLQVSTISEVKAGTVGNTYKIEATVVGLSKGIVVVKDATGLITLNFSSSNDAQNLAIGDKLSIQGQSRLYGGAVQFNYPTIEKLGQETVAQPTASLLDKDAFEALDKEKVEIVYIKLEAKLNISNNKYFNLVVDGSNKQGSISNPTQDLSSLNGKKVAVEGYFVYITESNNVRYLYIVATSVNEVIEPDQLANLTADQQGTYYHGGTVAIVTASHVSITTEDGTKLEFDIYVDKDGRVYSLENGEKVYSEFGDGTITNAFGTFTKDNGTQQPTHTLAHLAEALQGYYGNGQISVYVYESEVKVYAKDPENPEVYTLYVDDQGYYILDGDEKQVYCVFGEGTVTNEFGTFEKDYGNQQPTHTLAHLEEALQGFYGNANISVYVYESAVKVYPNGSEDYESYDLYEDKDGYYVLDNDGEKVYCVFGEGTVTNEFGTFTKDYVPQPTHTLAHLEEALQGYYGNGQISVYVYESEVKVFAGDAEEPLIYALYEDKEGYYVLDDEKQVYCVFGEGTVTNAFGTFEKDYSPEPMLAHLEEALQGFYYNDEAYAEVYESTVVLTHREDLEQEYLYVYIDKDGSYFLLSEDEEATYQCAFTDRTLSIVNNFFIKEANVGRANLDPNFQGLFTDSVWLLEVKESSVIMSFIGTDYVFTYDLYVNEIGQIFYESDNRRIFLTYIEEEGWMSNIGFFDKVVIHDPEANLPEELQGLYGNSEYTIEVWASVVGVTEKSSGETILYTLYEDEDGNYYVEEEGQQIVCVFGENSVTNIFGEFVKDYEVPVEERVEAHLEEAMQGLFTDSVYYLEVSESSVVLTEIGYEEGTTYTLYVDEEGNYFFDVIDALIYIFFDYDNGGWNTDIGYFERYFEGDDSEVVALVKEMLTKYQNNIVWQDVALEESYGGCSIEWATSNEMLMDALGHVYNSIEDNQVILTATITKGEATDTIDIIFTVRGIEAIEDMLNLNEEVYSTPHVAKGVVVATSYNGFVIRDKSGYIYVYFEDGFKYDLQIGDIAIVRGDIAYYGGLNQFAGAISYYAIGEDEVNEIFYETDGAGLDNYADNVSIVPIDIIGRLAISGNYCNLYIEGAEMIGSIIEVADYLADLDGKLINVKGYMVCVTGNNRYVSIMPVSIEEVEEGEQPEIETTPISKVLVSEVGADYVVDATVLAITYEGFVIGDFSGTMYVYMGSGYDRDGLEIGSKVLLSGATSQHGGRIQFSAPEYEIGETVELVSEEASLENMDGLAELVANNGIISPLIQIEGILVANGKYLNLNIGSETLFVSICNPIIAMDEYVDNKVMLTGYFVYTATSDGKTYAYLALTDIEVTEVLVQKVTVEATCLNEIGEGARIFILCYTDNTLRDIVEARIEDGVITASIRAEYNMIRIAEYYLDEEEVIPYNIASCTRASQNMLPDGTTFKLHIPDQEYYDKSLTVNEDGTWTIGISIRPNASLEDPIITFLDAVVFGYENGAYGVYDAYREETVVLEDSSNVVITTLEDGTVDIKVTVPAEIVREYTSTYFYHPNYKGGIVVDFYVKIFDGEEDLSYDYDLCGSFYFFRSFIDSVDTEGDGTEENPLTAADAYAIANYLPDGVWTNDEFYITGVVGSDPDDRYVNFTFTVNEDTFTVYGLLTSDGEYYYGSAYNKVAGVPVENGDTVVILARIYHYVDKEGVSTLETMDAKLIMVNGEYVTYELVAENNAEPVHAGTIDDPFDAADAALVASKLDAASQETSQAKYYISGKVTDEPTSTYCNFHIADGDNELYVYGLSSDENFKQRYGTNREIAEIPVHNGYSVLVYGNLQNYSGTFEVKNAWLVDYQANE